MLAYAAFMGRKPPTQLTMKFGFVEKRLEVPPEYLQRLLDVYGMLHEGVPGAICIQRLMVCFSPSLPTNHNALCIAELKSLADLRKDVIVICNGPYMVLESARWRCIQQSSQCVITIVQTFCRSTAQQARLAAQHLMSAAY